MLQLKAALHDLVEAILQATDPNTLDADAAERVHAAAEQLGAQLQTLDVVHQLEVLQLQAGDVLVLKMGDPSIGWIPAPDDCTKIAGYYREALDGLGLTDDKVKLVWSHYGCKPVVIRTAKQEATSDT